MTIILYALSSRTRSNTNSFRSILVVMIKIENYENGQFNDETGLRSAGPWPSDAHCSGNNTSLERGRLRATCSSIYYHLPYSHVHMDLSCLRMPTSTSRFVREAAEVFIFQSLGGFRIGPAGIMIASDLAGFPVNSDHCRGWCGF